MWPVLKKTNHFYPSPLSTHEEVVNQPKIFLDTLKSLHSMLGTRFMVPVIGRKELNLHVLYVEVTNRGGYVKVVSEKRWREISSIFNFSSTTTSASFVLKKHYLSLLYQYEQVYFFKLQGPVLAPPLAGPCPVGPDVGGTDMDDHEKYEPKRVQDSVNKAVGTIHGKFDCGYLVSIKIGQDLLSGVIYHPVDEPSTSSFLDEEDLSMALVPYDPSTPRRSSAKRRQRKRKRWGRDPSHPKPNRSGYNFFFAEKHALLKSLHPNTREREFTKMIGELWNNLSFDEKMVYQNIGLRDKERYRKELQEYNAKLATIRGNMNNL
ncbi:high mobility group B protein 9 isoform X2 [Beta vulgaris subsp. vulgaris]|uniref:high mobility group B protein 9 isoform X2 n=1 Tax=Beta vulgaris subsp. vulgaris TaxID=3555 RepID=UPI00053FECB1|nr:high mobility group B protein 9 isoform X2 [Beta vulgaris subsp. vulgaris]